MNHDHALRYWQAKFRKIIDSSELLPACYQQPSLKANLRSLCVSQPILLPAESTEVLVLAAYSLVLSRYGAGESIALAITDGFLLLHVDEKTIASDFVEAVARELSQTLQNSPMPTSVLEDKDIGENHRQRAKFHYGFAPHASEVCASLALIWGASKRGLELRFAYDNVVYPEFLVEQIATHTIRLIPLLVARGSSELHRLDVVAVYERTKFLTKTSGTVRTRHKRVLHGFVQEAALRSPDSVAVIFEGKELSYSQLWEYSERIAAHLRSTLGIRRGGRVGICVGRSELMVAAILGILGCAAAYVPINLQHPWPTIRHILSEARISAVIVDSESIAKVSAFHGDIFVLDVELANLTDTACVQLDTAVGSDDAYIIYTSGSTGSPKGVVVQHQAIVNTILWRNEYYKYNRADVTLQIPSIAFDSSAVDIFCTLAAGGTLVIPREELRLDAQYLCNLITRHGVTNFLATPSHYRLFCKDLTTAGSSLRAITLAGETVTKELAAMHFHTLPYVLLYNEYGPTECAVCSTACLLSPAESNVTIGSPIDNVQIYIVDDHNRLCAPGMPGEICIGGAGLAREYVDRPDLTALAFIEHPVVELPPRRVYRSGDRGYWLSDGRVHFIGRRDGQVKISGMRLELSAIEETLLSCPGVSNGAVVCKEDDSHTPYLAAFLVIDRTRTDLLNVRAHLKQLLPRTAVPEILACLDQLPLLASGKIDRAGLARYQIDEQRRSDAKGIPSAFETQLLNIVSSVLRRSAISLDDDIFDLGAHSLRVMEMFSKIRDLGCAVALTDLYTYSTIRALANRLSSTL